MSCMLRAMGQEFDVEAFLEGTTLAAAAAYHRGDPRGGGTETHSASGLTVVVSRGAPDPDTETGEAIDFLGLHEEELRRLGSFEGVQEVCLEFALAPETAARPSLLFPAELLWRAGALDIDLVITHSLAAPAGPTH